MLEYQWHSFHTFCTNGPFDKKKSSSLSPPPPQHQHQRGVWKLHWAALVGIPHKAAAAHVVFATTTTGVASERNTIMDTTQSNPTRFSQAWYNTDPATVDDHPAPTLNCQNSRERRPSRPFLAAQRVDSWTFIQRQKLWRSNRSRRDRDTCSNWIWFSTEIGSTINQVFWYSLKLKFSLSNWCRLSPCNLWTSGVPFMQVVMVGIPGIPLPLSRLFIVLGLT